MSFCPQHILVPVAIDSDEDLHLAKRALFAACDIAEKFHSKITLLHLAQVVGPGASAGVDISGRIYQSLGEVLEARLKHSQRVLYELKNLGKDRGLAIEARIIDSPETTADVILQSANELKADLLVLGSHGRLGLSRVFFGSVAQKVSEKAPMPVLLLHSAKVHKGLKK